MPTGESSAVGRRGPRPLPRVAIVPDSQTRLLKFEAVRARSSPTSVASQGRADRYLASGRAGLTRYAT